MTKTYIVTGGAGFIGSNFIHYMLKRYDDIHLVNVDALTYAGNLENLASIENDKRYTFAQVDIRNNEAVKNIFSQYQPDYVINFAAESHVDRSIENPNIFADTNIMGTVNLLNAAKEFWACETGFLPNHKFLQVSTDEVYGSLDLDSPDDFFRESTPINPHSPYSASKASADMFVMAYKDTFGLPINITRCSNNYGPYQFPEKLIPLMINNALHHEKLPIYGDGLNIRDWLYVEDHCKAIDAVSHEAQSGEVYNVGGHNEHSNKEIVEVIIEKLAKITGDSEISTDLITYVADRKGHDRRYGIAPDKINHDLAWLPETSFEVGIEKTIKWYLAHLDWMQHIVEGEYQNYYKKMYAQR